MPREGPPTTAEIATEAEQKIMSEQAVGRIEVLYANEILEPVNQVGKLGALGELGRAIPSAIGTLSGGLLEPGRFLGGEPGSTAQVDLAIARGRERAVAEMLAYPNFTEGYNSGGMLGLTIKGVTIEDEASALEVLDMVAEDAGYAAVLEKRRGEIRSKRTGFSAKAAELERTK
jgi:hypothetical protein